MIISTRHTTVQPLNNNLEILMAREQLLYEIECIVDQHLSDNSSKGAVTKELCDAVCKHIHTTQLRRRRTRKSPSSCNN
jgi:hypothetical protein